MKKGLILIIVLFNGINCFSQFSIPLKKDAIEASKRVLLVELKEIDQKRFKKVEKFTDEEKLTNYEEFLGFYNENIRNFINQYWSTNKEIHFKTSDEIDDLIKENKSKYVVLSSEWRGEQIGDMNGVRYSDYYTFSLYFSEKAKKRKKYFVDRSGKTTVSRGPYIFKVSVISNKLSQADYKFVIDQFNYHINYASIYGKDINVFRAFQLPDISEEQYDKAKKSQLLIPEEWLDSKVTSKEIEKLYSFNFTILPLNKIDSIILNGEKGYLYFNFSWSEKSRGSAFCIIDNETGAPICEVNSGTSGFAVHGYPTLFGIKPIYSWRQVVSLQDNHFTAVNGIIENNGKYGLIKYLKDRKSERGQ
jgi:hypothetical protein